MIITQYDNNTLEVEETYGATIIQIIFGEAIYTPCDFTVLTILS